MKADSELQDHLYTLEERLLHPDREADRNALVPLFAKEYKEFCPTGRIYNRQQTLDVLLNHSARPASIHHFYVEQLSENVALATYRASTRLQSSHRSSLWILRDKRWQLFFHQGTVVS
jgi:hypothetical protein